MCYIHTIEYYLSIKRNEVLVCATSYMNFENIKLHETSQSQQITYVLYYSIYVKCHRIGTSRKTESKWLPTAVSGVGERNGYYC